MAYNNSQSTESVNVNTAFLLFYLDTLKEMAKTFANKDVEQFELYVYFVRSCISRSKIRNDIDELMEEMRKKLENQPQFDEKMKKFLTGFIVVEKCVDYLDHTLHITEHDAAALIDSTDMNIKIQLDKLALYKLAAQLKSQKIRGDIENKIFTQDICNVDQLIEEVTKQGLTEDDFKSNTSDGVKEALGISEDAITSQDVGAEIPDIEYNAGEG